MLPHSGSSIPEISISASELLSTCSNDKQKWEWIMNTKTEKITNRLLLIIAVMSFVTLTVSNHIAFAQEWRWLRIGELQCFFSDRGTEVESEGYGPQTNFLSWPAQYGVIDQTTVRQKCMWIGCKNFYDTVEGKIKDYKVVGTGPRERVERPYMIFEQDIKVYGKYLHPNVIVDDQIATDLALYEQLDDFDENLPCDRIIVIRINTSIGVSVTKKILAFSRPDHSNYFINDITYKNTGIINRAGDVYQQTLEDVWFYFAYRYAFAGESYGSYGEGW